MKFIQTVHDWLLPTAHAQLSTTTAGNMVTQTVSSAGDLLQDTLPVIFGLGLAVAIVILVYAWVKGMLRRPG